MQKARTSASFRPLDLTHIIYDGEENFRRRELVMSRIEAALGDKPGNLPAVYERQDRKSLYHDGLRFGKALLESEIRDKHGFFDRRTHRHTLINASPFGLHSIMFIPTLKLQASPEQLAYWLPLAESGKIIGTYCQTELGHGTFLRGLETTATFDSKTDEFVIHSPTIGSTKYWPGGVGYSTTHAVVMARLVVGRTDHGVHGFMVQLRSLEDFKPLPGIELGDIGMTMGLNSTDNGYAVFNRVRIPRHHMMMRNARFSRDGTYTKAALDKHSYSTMIYTRMCIIHTMAFQLAQAATIAIRYSAVREQGNLHFDPAISNEMTIISYKSQHYRLLTIMSRACAILFASKACENVYEDLISRQAQDDHSTLPYGHITTAALKAWATQTAADGAEDARKCCGGHGYSVLSGMPNLVNDVVPMATLEGENYVMYQQAARYLMKCVSAIQRGQALDASMAYLRDRRDGERCPAHGGGFLNPDVQLSIFRHRAIRLAYDCHVLLDDSVVRDGLSQDAAWNLHMMSLIVAARAHIEYFVLQSFVDQVACVTNPAVHSVLVRLRNLFALSTIESPFSIGALGFFEDAYISSAQLKEIRAHVNRALEALLPEAVGLTDAWAFSDASLQSALGQKDGNVYETLMSWTRQLPFNRACREAGGVDREGFEKYIRPILRAKL
ncbi:putative acyl-CoA oxidase family protein [Lyophyllum shimeji]|uniref:Acyl-coenzyme A oxidase n=1 Tax=Lyophyllum shimeji TaxID=47721 RepID=A0A9P3PSM7_LYOSH|nr:putative acyl-CoA oxidase family protein [Lyophyllum shimeji]